MVPNIWFFCSRILTLQYFWLIIFCNYLNSSCAFSGEKKMDRPRRFRAN